MKGGLDGSLRDSGPDNSWKRTRNRVYRPSNPDHRRRGSSLSAGHPSPRSSVEHFYNVLDLESVEERAPSFGTIYGSDWDTYRAAEQSSTATRWEAEAVRYKSIDFAIDTAVARDWLKFQELPHWLAALSTRWPSGPIVDLACGEGILTSLLALLRPSDEILGVDITPEATRAAAAVASRFGAENARFLTADAAVGLADLGGPYTVASSFVFWGPKLGASTGGEGDTWRQRLAALRAQCAPLPAAFHDIVVPDAWFLSAERLSGAGVPWWFGTIEATGFRVDQETLRFFGVGETSLLMLAARRTTAGSTAPTMLIEPVTGNLRFVVVKDGQARLVVETDHDPVDVDLGPRDLAALRRSLTRKHIDFTTRAGDLTLLTSGGELRLTARKRGRPSSAHVLSDEDFKHLNEALAALA
jgi:SAM-dependent methyltransferase